VSNASFQKPSDLTNWAYKIIKSQILNFEVKVGEQLHVEALADKMGISRTPIREALLRLVNEGLVKAESRVGYFVRGVTKRDLRELFELREILEGYAAEKAAALLQDDELDYIEQVHQKSIRAVRESKLSRFVEMEIRLHDIIIEKSDNRRLLSVLESLKDLTYRERVLSVKSMDNVKASLTEHSELVKALKSRNGALASQKMKEHIRAVKGRLLEFLDPPDEV
jgi:DNA-binding GntR family transcriptional regulator